MEEDRHQMQFISKHWKMVDIHAVVNIHENSSLLIFFHSSIASSKPHCDTGGILLCTSVMADT